MDDARGMTRRAGRDPGAAAAASMIADARLQTPWARVRVAGHSPSSWEQGDEAVVARGIEAFNADQFRKAVDQLPSRTSTAMTLMVSTMGARHP